MSLSTPAKELVAARGAVLGSYRLVAELGSGGMGTVWFAEHTTIGRRAAIKVLHPQFASDREVVARFIDEARAASAIRHPNIVDIQDFGHQGHLNWLVMEMLEGETLGARLERSRRLSPADLVPIVDQVGKALGAAHQRGIIHRDLKPENVFLAAGEDGPESVKILDFGIAKLTGKATGAATMAGVIVGTPTYMSPEQCVGDATLDHRTDVYSLGVMLYEMLAGTPPFVGDSFGRLVIGHMTELPTPLRHHDPNLDRAVTDIVEKALAKKSEDRFSSIASMAEAFREAVFPSKETRRNRAAQKSKDAQQSEDVAHELLAIIDKKLEGGNIPLPAMPIAVVEALALLDLPDCSFDTVAERLQADPLVTTRVLALVNSPAFGAREPIKQLSDACRRLGMKPLRSLLVSLAARKVFQSRDPRIREAFERIWAHCVATALLAQRLADRVFGIDPAAAYLAGLLHDVGKPVVAVFLLEAEKLLLDELGTPWLSADVWERTVLAAHQRVGLAMADRWQLPAEVREAIVGQHAYQDDRRYGNLIRYLDALATVEGYGAEENGDDPTEVLLAGRMVWSTDGSVEASLVEGLAPQVDALCGGERRRVAPSAAPRA